MDNVKIGIQPHLSVFEDVYEAFRPQAIVVQCGGDCLAGDPIGRFNLSISGIARCVKSVLGKIFKGYACTPATVDKSTRLWPYPIS